MMDRDATFQRWVRTQLSDYPRYFRLGPGVLVQVTSPLLVGSIDRHESFSSQGLRPNRARFRVRAGSEGRTILAMGAMVWTSESISFSAVHSTGEGRVRALVMRGCGSPQLLLKLPSARLPGLESLPGHGLLRPLTRPRGWVSERPWGMGDGSVSRPSGSPKQCTALWALQGG